MGPIRTRSPFIHPCRLDSASLPQTPWTDWPHCQIKVSNLLIRYLSRRWRSQNLAGNSGDAAWGFWKRDFSSELPWMGLQRPQTVLQLFSAGRHYIGLSSNTDHQPIVSMLNTHAAQQFNWSLNLNFPNSHTFNITAHWNALFFGETLKL